MPKTLYNLSGERAPFDREVSFYLIPNAIILPASLTSVMNKSSKPSYRNQSQRPANYLLNRNALLFTSAHIRSCARAARLVPLLKNVAA